MTNSYQTYTIVKHSQIACKQQEATSTPKPLGGTSEGARETPCANYKVLYYNVMYYVVSWYYDIVYHIIVAPARTPTTTRNPHTHASAEEGGQSQARAPKDTARGCAACPQQSAGLASAEKGQPTRKEAARKCSTPLE